MVVPLVLAERPPDLLVRRAAVAVAGGMRELCKAQDPAQRFPSGLGALVELLAGEGVAEVITSGGHLELYRTKHFWTES